MLTPEKPVKLKDPNESADEQQGVTQGNKDLADRKIERKRKREESPAGNTRKKSKVGYPHIPVGGGKIPVQQYINCTHMVLQQTTIKV